MESTPDEAAPVDRLPDLQKWLTRKSHFLLGPRQTGKTYLIRRTLATARVYDLLDTATYLALSQQPGRIAEALSGTTGAEPVVVIDEIQRLPVLLNEVQRLIETRGTRFLPTGSSARGLRRAA